MADPFTGPRQNRPTTRRGTRERVVLVGIEGTQGGNLNGLESLVELERLADSAGLTTVARVVQALRRPHAATYIGAGKVEEVRRLATAVGAEVVIFDEPLSPAQQRNLERELQIKVIDRSQLILDIFAQRARSLEGKLQVELAQLQYLLPRLTRQWQHLSRLGGGVGTRGPGETQLEVDRRKVRERVAHLRRRLRAVSRTRHIHRASRSEVPFPTIALVGYTNAGKSTLMNRLTAADCWVADRLFATLDPTTRQLRLPGGTVALLVDTVGFINKLPHGFVDAFKSTLEEVQSADLLLHVVDASHPQREQQQVVVQQVLAELGAENKPCLLVFNKIDLLHEEGMGLPKQPDACLVSARTGQGIEDLIRQVEQLLMRRLHEVRVALPLSRGDLVARAHRLGRVVSETYSEDRIELVAFVPENLAGQLRKCSLVEASPHAATGGLQPS